jgi:hypothetical protein
VHGQQRATATYRDNSEQPAAGIEPAALAVAFLQALFRALHSRTLGREPRKVLAIPLVTVAVGVGRVVVPEREVNEIGLETREQSVHHALLPVEVVCLEGELAAGGAGES